MNLQNMLRTLTDNIIDCVQQLVPNGQVRPTDLGLIVISSAAGFAVMLGCTRTQLEENWAEVMRMLDGDAQAETKRAAFHLVGPDGKPLTKGEPS
jgi:hypothetical protein